MTGSWFLNELQWIDLNKGNTDSSPRNDREGDKPYENRSFLTAFIENASILISPKK